VASCTEPACEIRVADCHSLPLDLLPDRSIERRGSITHTRARARTKSGRAPPGLLGGCRRIMTLTGAASTSDFSPIGLANDRAQPPPKAVGWSDLLGGLSARRITAVIPVGVPWLHFDATVM
jgi:hypothetical protein